MKQQRASKRSATHRALWPGPAIVVSVVGLVAAAAAILILSTQPSRSPTGDTEIVVYKMATCGCCNLWIEHLRDDGLAVSVINVQNTRSVRSRVGVPSALGSCHTAVAGDYWIEGHVPADVIQELLASQPPDIRGLVVPGMPIGSPGMEAPNPVSYDILSVDQQGEVRVYATRDGKATR